MSDEDLSYEIIPITPIKKLEERIDKMESSGPTTNLQGLMNNMIELIRSNQKIVNDVIRANSDLRNELSKLPAKIDDLISTMNNFLSLVEAGSREDVTETPKPDFSAETLKPVVEELKKISEQNQKMVESNESVMEELSKVSKRVRGGMPVSALLSNYPMKREPRSE
jgi:chromosome segregation ATPase